MLRKSAVVLVLIVSTFATGMFAQIPAARPKFEEFEVATVKPVDPGEHFGRMFKMDGPHRWSATNFTLKSLIALAYDLNPRTISGGPGWMETKYFTIEAITPGDVRPTRLEQMQMLRALLVERFVLKFHREQKEFAIFSLNVAKGGPKLKAAAKPEDPPQLYGVVYPGKIEVPARSVTMEDFVAMLQRATLDRPTVNRTGLTGKYDFDLVWAQDETQYGGELEKAPDDAPNPPLYRNTAAAWAEARGHSRHGIGDGCRRRGEAYGGLIDGPFQHRFSSPYCDVPAVRSSHPTVDELSLTLKQ